MFCEKIMRVTLNLRRFIYVKNNISDENGHNQKSEVKLRKQSIIRYNIMNFTILEKRY